MENPFLRHNINEICAICFRVHGRGGSSSLLTMLPVKQPIETYKALEFISKFKYNVDGPQYLCSNCFYKTTFLNDFQKMCNEAQRFYDDYIELQNSAKIPLELNESNYTLRQNNMEQEIENLQHTPNLEQQENYQIKSSEESGTILGSNNSGCDNRGLDVDGTDSEEYNATEHQGEKSIECRRHMKNDHHTCPTCRKCFAQVDGLIKHITNIEECKQSDDFRKDLLQQLVCSICSAFCGSFFYLKTHMKIHTRTEPITCDICNKNLRDKFTLKRHMKTMHGEGIQKEALHKCKYCNKEFKNSTYLHTIHYPTHENDCQYVCQFCGRAFSKKIYLWNHENVHKGIKKYKCEYCDKRFTSTSERSMHHAAHSEIRPYQCKVCGKKFKRSGHLRTHMVTHSDERPHVCIICNRGFTQAHCLRSHLQTHVQNVESQEASG